MSVKTARYQVECDSDEFEHGELFGTEKWPDGVSCDKSMEEIIIDAANCSTIEVEGRRGLKPGDVLFAYIVRETKKGRTREEG